MAADDRGLRLDEVAQAAGVPTTTVRLYQNKGLLDGPRLVGRVGYYDRSHVARLRLIGRLQEEGFSLAAIGRLLEAWRAGRDLHALIGVESELDDVLNAGRSIVVDAERLLAALGAEAVTPETVRRSVELGLIEPLEDGTFRVLDERFLESGAALTELGVPAEVTLDEWHHLSTMTDAIAKRFLAIFDTHLLRPGWTLAELTPTAAGELTTTLQRLRRVATTVVTAALDASLAELARARLAELGRAVAEANDR